MGILSYFVAYIYNYLTTFFTLRVPTHEISAKNILNIILSSLLIHTSNSYIILNMVPYSFFEKITSRISDPYSIE